MRYGKRVAVDGLSLTLKPGEIVAMLGPNGAGKSTTLLAIAGSLIPSRGDVRIRSRSAMDASGPIQGQVGFADQPPSLYEFFTVAEHLAFVGESRGHTDIKAQRTLLDALGLGGIADRLCRELSFGMRQRVGLAAALVGDISVVLLDETLNGLDPRAAKSAREVVENAAKEGIAVLMSTHLLGVAERLCHRILIMDQGTLKTDVSGTELDALLDQGPGAVESLYLSMVAESELS